MNFQLFVYPLNVYAQTLALEYGSAEHLHFGLADAGDGTDYTCAQQAVQDLFREALLPAPATVLEVGFGLGTLARALAAAGYSVTALSNNPEEVRIAKQLSDEVAWRWSDFAEYQAGPEPEQQFDILLFQHSAQYFDSVQLLTKTKKLLNTDGQLLILDEFLLDDTEQSEPARSVLEHFLAQAERCGLRLVSQRNIGERVAPGLLQFCSLLEKHAAVLTQKLALAPSVVADLAARFAATAEQLQSQQMGFVLLEFRRAAATPHEPELGNIHSFDPLEVAPVFESSFDTTFDPGIWHWKYGAGHGRAVCARVDGRLVGHYGGASRDIRYFGMPRKAIQICDVMVMPAYRSFANRDTLFFKMAATFLEQQIGNVAEHLLGFGFPNVRVMRVAKRLRLYDTTDSFIEIHYPQSCASLPGSDWEVASFDLADGENDAVISDLWHMMASDLEQQIVGVRNPAYLHYRYCSHPLWQSGVYFCQSVRPVGAVRPAVIAILKQCGDENLLMDIIGKVEYFPLVVAALNADLQKKKQTLHCRITKGQAEKLTLPGSEWRDIGIEIPCNIWTRGPRRELLQGAWWLTAGDMDFI